MADTESLIHGLTGRDNNHAYRCLLELEELSGLGSEVYRYFDVFDEMLSDASSFVRTRAFLLISANARWDEDNRIDESLDRYLKCINDVKPIAARQCIKALPALAKHKPELQGDIIDALRRVNVTIYPESMQSLLRKDIRDSLARMEPLA